MATLPPAADFGGSFGAPGLSSNGNMTTIDAASAAAISAVGWVPILAGFVDAWNADPRAVWSSFAMIIVSEIGDKTFLIAAILAMRESRTLVFAGAFSSLAVMSVLSALLGVMFPSLLPKSLTTFMAAVLFFVFGARMMREGFNMTGAEMGEEWEEAQREIEEEEREANEGGEHHELQQMEEGERPLEEDGKSASAEESTPKTNGHAYPPVSSPSRDSDPSFSSRPRTSIHEHRDPVSVAASALNLKEGARNLCGLCFSPVFAQAFVLTFLGEWGDRSQVATIALAAAHNVALVSFGTIVGHACCTGVAVMGGSWLASRISVKHVTLGGATLFLLFGLIYTYEALASGELSATAKAGSARLGDALGAGTGAVEGWGQHLAGSRPGSVAQPKALPGSADQFLGGAMGIAP